MRVMTPLDRGGIMLQHQRDHTDTQKLHRPTVSGLRDFIPPEQSDLIPSNDLKRDQAIHRKAPAIIPS